MKCEYCKREFKNEHGVHIHWFYCLVKGFSEMKIIKVDNKMYHELLGDSYFISCGRYLTSFLKFIKNNEIGMKFNKRYILL